MTAFAAPWFTSHPVARVKILAMGVLVGGACQFLVMVPTLLREGMPFRIATRHPGLKKIMTMMIPATIGQSVVQISLVVNTMIGWLIGEGAITALNYGNRLMNFPLGVLGVSIAQTAVPTLSRQVAVGDPGELKKTLTYLFRVTIFVMIPASAGLMALSQPIIRLLFQHGEFDVLATLKTSGCLYWFATGLVFYTLVKILAPIFYAFEDTRTPVVVAIISMIFNIIVNLLLMDSMKESGLALSTALTSCLNVTLLLWFLRKRIGLLGLRAIIPTFFKVVLIATVMGISVSKVAAYFEPAATVALRVTQVGVGLTTGVVIYSLLAWLIRLEEFNDSIVYVKKRLAR
jgi:putative peptidoglycan lipid II flippase